MPKTVHLSLSDNLHNSVTALLTSLIKTENWGSQRINNLLDFKVVNCRAKI